MSGHVGALLPDFLDNELAGDRRAAVEAHLGSCASCRVELERLRSVGDLLRSLPQQPLPAGFMQKLERRRDNRQPQSRTYWLAPPRAIAFALSGLILGLLVYDRARVMLPFGDSGFASDPSRLPSPALSALDLEQARNAKPPRALARAHGEPLDETGAIAVGSAGSASSGPTNEELQTYLEKQKKRMGIRAIAAKRGAALTLAQSDESGRTKLEAAVQPIRVDATKRPANLKQAQETAAEGFVLRSEEERRHLWARFGLHLAPPSTNYSRNALVLVVAPDMTTAIEILGVQTLQDRISVRYRLLEHMQALAGAAMQAGTPARAYQFRVVPKTDKPVSFDKVD